MSPPTSPTPQPTRAKRATTGSTALDNTLLGITGQTTDGDRASFTRLPDERLLAAHIDGETLYYLTDGLGSTVAMTNQAGETINTYRYGPYGEAEDTVEGITQPFQYAGGYHDEATGWTNSGSATCRPNSAAGPPKTPLRQLLEPVDANRYTYASNNPINLVDPSGANSCFWEGASAVLAVAGAAFAGASVFYTAGASTAPAWLALGVAGVETGAFASCVLAAEQSVKDEGQQSTLGRWPTSFFSLCCPLTYSGSSVVSPLFAHCS